MTVWVSIELSEKQRVREHIALLKSDEHETKAFLSILSCNC